MRLPTPALAFGLLATTILSASPAAATPTLLATGVLSGAGDLSGLAGTLENGLAANVLGGMGSGLAWAGGTTFLATPDRGPNATPFNSNIDDTTSFIQRFHTVDMALTPNGSHTSFTLTPTLASTTLLYSNTPLNYGTGAGLGTEKSGAPLRSGASQNSPGKSYFTGRSDNFGAGASGNPNNARLDSEGIRLSADGKSVFVSDEYGPYLYQFDRATGRRIRTFALPNSGAGNLDVPNLSPKGDTEINGNLTGRTANKGMEGLALTPDGKTLVGMMQAALIQDNVNPTKKLLRIVTVDIATGATHEYGYLLTDGTGVSEITAINNHEFLVDERDGKGLGDGSAAVAKKLFKIDLNGAQDIAGLSGAAALAKAVPKTQVVDLVALLNAAGIGSRQIPAKIEGLAFGQDVTVNVNGVLTQEHTLWIANDNDFVPDTAGPNRFFVLGLTDADLGGSRLLLQSVPEPGSLALLSMGVGGVIAMMRRRSTRAG